MREHGALVARVCMALLGDAGAVERALERVARDAGAATFEDGQDPLVPLMGFARAACATQLSKLPIRNTASWSGDAKPETERDQAREPGLARAARTAIGRLKPTEREAIVLHLVGGLEAAQVARACGIDVETARQRIARGVAQLVQEEKRR
jgi:DNA-directed RNA polymerase specialized sigma24 family protein